MLTRWMFGGHSFFVLVEVCEEPAFLHHQGGKGQRQEGVCVVPRDSAASLSPPFPGSGGSLLLEGLSCSQRGHHHTSVCSRGRKLLFVPACHTWISGMCGSPTHMDLQHTWISGTHGSLLGTRGSLLGTRGSQSPTWTGDLNPWFSVSIIQTQT